MTDKKFSQAPTKTEDSLPDTSEWPLLLKNFHTLNVKSNKYTPIAAGSTPHQRPLEEYLKYSFINLDKPSNPSSHDIVAWIKKILELEKTGHSGTLDPKVTGCLIICLNRATRLAKAQQQDGKEYVAVMSLHQDIPESFKKLKNLSEKEIIQQTLKSLEGPIFQKPPAISAVSKKLRIRTIYKNTLCEYD